MKAYLNYFKLRFLNILQYRAAAISGIATQLFFGFAIIMVYIALYSSNDQSNLPMTLRETISYMWLGQAFFGLTHVYTKDQDLLTMIKNGNLAYELIRPQDFYFKYYVKIVSEKVASVVLRFWPIVIVAILLPMPYNLSAPISIPAFLIFILGLGIAGLLTCALSLLVHMIVMFLLDSRGIFSFYTVIAELFMGAIVPIPFLPSILQKIAIVLPFRYITDFPYRIYTGNIPTSEGVTLLGMSILWLTIIILIGYLLSKRALKKAVIQGG